MSIPSLNIRFSEKSSLLCIGAHCDDIEIGCSATVMHLLEMHPHLRVTWLVLTGSALRQDETRAAANRVISNADHFELIFSDFRDGFLPYSATEVKETFEEVKARCNPDLVLSHWEGDRHQDHRLVSELTGSTFRNSLILEYEIPKYDGDMGRPNVYVPVSAELLSTKIEILLESFESQRSKAWFDEETFTSLHRLRGMESGADERYAEAFYCRKMALQGSAGPTKREI